MCDHPDDHAPSDSPTTDSRLPHRTRGAAFGAETGHPVPPPPGSGPPGERVVRPLVDPAGLLRPAAPPAARAPSGNADDEPGYVIHLPVHVGDIEAATRLACTVAGSLAFLAELDPGETTISTADDQNNRHRVFCDLPLPDRSRCPKRFGHGGACGPPDGGSEAGMVPAPRKH